MKAINRISFLSAAVLVVMGMAMPSMAAPIWSDNFEDGDDVGWREHTAVAADQAMFSAVASSGVGGSVGYERTGGTAFDHAEGIFTTTSSSGLLANGDKHVLSAEVKLGFAATNSRTGITWGYNATGWPVNHYWIVIQNSDHIEIQDGQIQAGSATLAAGTNAATAGADFAQFNTLSATFERVGSDVLITAFLNGLEQVSFLDTTSPLGVGTYFAGVTTGFFSVIDGDFPEILANTVFDDISLSTVPVPEPASLGLVVLGGVMMTLRGRRSH